MGERRTESVLGVTITLVDVGEFSVVDQSNFALATQEFYETIYPKSGSSRRQRHLRRLQVVPGVTDLTTTIKYRGQNVAGNTNTITYDQDVTYTSVTAANVFSIIRGPFDDEALASQYTDLLQARGGAFAEISDVQQPVNQRNNDDDDGGLSGGAIGGIIAAGVVLFAVGVYLMVRSSGSRTHTRMSASGNEPPASFSVMQSEEVSTMDDANIVRAGTGDTGSMMDHGDQR